MKYMFILNPISGPVNQPFQIIDTIDRVFRSSGHQYEFALTTGPGDATRLTEEAVHNRFDFVVAAGGDGTVNEVGRALIHTSTSLGIIPLGSGNGVARSMKIPLRMENTLDFLLRPSVNIIDMGKVNDEYFIGVCGLGFDATIGQKFQDFGARGPLPYFIIGMRELITYKPEPLRIYLDHQELSVTALVVAIANTQQYGNGAIIAPHADPRDGLFDLCVLDHISFSKAVRLSFRLFKGTIDQSSEYRHFRTNEIKIESSNSQSAIHTDGEPHWCRAPLHFRLLPQALRICAPLEGKDKK